MNKRGADVAVNPLIMIALGVFVLIVLIVIFKDQITKGSGKYDDISKQATLDQEKCSFVLGRTCRTGTTCPSGETLVIVKEGECTSGKTCCAKS